MFPYITLSSMRTPTFYTFLPFVDCNIQRTTAMNAKWSKRHMDPVVHIFGDKLDLYAVFNPFLLVFVTYGCFL